MDPLRRHRRVCPQDTVLDEGGGLLWCGWPLATLLAGDLLIDHPFSSPVWDGLLRTRPCGFTHHSRWRQGVVGHRENESQRVVSGFTFASDGWSLSRLPVSIWVNARRQEQERTWRESLPAQSPPHPQVPQAGATQSSRYVQYGATLGWLVWSSGSLCPIFTGWNVQRGVLR